ncbi:MAG: DUF58 domain-containing protein [Myxococcales bacterium]|nr:DUF58 domain-containing protein [Myxococcales bacterium]
MNASPPARGRLAGCIAPVALIAILAALGIPPLGIAIAAAIGLIGTALSARRARGRSRLRFTREGRYLVAITLGIGFAAVNTGNNLLFLVLGMLLSFIIVSGVLSEQTLRGLAVVRDLPREVHAGHPFLTGITLTNTKTRLPSFSIQVEDIVDGRPVAKKCYFLKVPAGASQQTSYRSEFPRRGAYAYQGLRVGTRFPFSFFVKSRELEAPGRLLVLPKVSPVAELPLPAQSLVGELDQRRRGLGREFHGLRHHRPGDDARDVHWKRSAREGRLILREYASQGTRRVTVVINDRVPADLDLGAEAVRDALDECCDVAASLLVHFTQRHYGVELRAGSQSHFIDAEGRGLVEALRVLALLTFSPPAEEAARPVGSADSLILISHRRARHLVAGPFAHVFEAGA